MRNSLFISGFLLLAACQSGTEQPEAEQPQPATQHQMQTAPEAPKDTVSLEQKLEKTREEARKPAEVMGGEISVQRHKAPNQERIDSIKAAKTKGKK